MEVGNPSMRENYESDVDTTRNFNVIKNLKETEGQCELLKNRIKILQLNDERNVKKIQNNQIKIEKIQLVRNQAHHNQKSLNEIKKIKLQSLQQRKKKNKDLKESIVKQTKANLENLHSQKSENYEQLTKQSKSNHKKIESIKLQSIEKRKEKYEEIVQAKERSKQNIMDFAMRKNKTIHEEQTKQNLFLTRKREKKLEEIQNLEKAEMELLKKYSESHQAFKSVKNKLDQMLGKIKKDHSKDKKQLKEGQKSNGRSESFYILSQNRQ